jgi:hypothetical protein
MPFKSKAQQRFMFSQHPEMAKEWADKTPDISKLPEHVKKMAEGGNVSDEPGVQDATLHDIIGPALAALAGGVPEAAEGMAEMAPEMMGSEAGEVSLGSAPEMEGMPSKIQVFSKGIQKGGSEPITIWGVKGSPEDLMREFGDPNPGSVPESVLKAKGLLPDTSVSIPTEMSPNSYAQGGEIEDSADKEFHSEMREEGPKLGISHQGYADGGEVKKVNSMSDIGTLAGLRDLMMKLSGKTDAQKADDIDPVITSSGTAHGSTDSPGAQGYDDGGEVDPVDMMTQAAIPSAMPTDVENGAAPLPPMNPPGAQDLPSGVLPNAPYYPPPNPIAQASSAAQSIPPTNPGIYQGITADQRAALMQQLLAQKSSPGMLAAKGLGGLGDAITSAFGKSPTNAMGNIQANENANIANKIGVVDTQRQQRMQDLQANLAQQENDPNSAYSSGMRQFYSQLTGKQFPSGISASMMKSAFPDYAKIFDSQLVAQTAKGTQQVEAQKAGAAESPWKILMDRILGNPAETALQQTATGGQTSSADNGGWSVVK